MKILVPLSFASILLVSACAISPQDKGDAQTHVAAQSTSSVHHYQCESGETIATTYPSTNSATVQYKGSTYNMQIAVSGSGSRYVGGGLEWWTKGSGPESDGTLFRHMADGTSDESVERCTESKVRTKSVWTPLVEKQVADTAKARGISEAQVKLDVMLKAQPTKRFVTVDEVAAVAVFLCSDGAASITGSTLPVEGGWVAQ